MTDEEYFRKYYPDFCYYGKPLSPYWDLFQDGVEFGERQSEKKITELEKENAELKAEIENDRDLPTVAYMQGAEKQKKKDEKQLTKAKEHIENLLYYVRQCTCERSNYAEMDEDIKQAEQYLKEIEK